MRPLFGVVLLGVLALGQDLDLVSLSPPAKVRPGDFAVQVWQIINHTPAALVAHVDVELPAGWEVLGLPDAISLGPGEEDYLFLTLYVPRTAPSGLHSVRLRLRWDEGEKIAETAVEVEAVAALEILVPPPQAVSPGETLVFTLRVVNRGNALDQVTLEVRPPPGWRSELEPKEISLSPGEAREVRVSLEIPGDARPSREVVMAVARSGIAPEVEVRTAWYVEVLPPGPEKVPVQKFAELSMQGLGRFSHEFLRRSGSSFLGFSGRGTVLDGALELSARWAGPWAPEPLRFLEFRAIYVTDTAEMEVGRVGFSFPYLLSSLGFWGLGTRLTLERISFSFGSGWDRGIGRSGGSLSFRPEWGEVGGAYREERGDGVHNQGGAVWLVLQVFEDLRFRLEAGAARTQGLTRFAGQMGLTWEIPEIFFLEAKGYAMDPGFPALMPDRAGVLLSGRVGAEEAGFRFACEWQRDNLRGLSLTTRAWQGIQAGWEFFPADWPLRFNFSLSLRRAADLTIPPSLDERTARAEASSVFSQEGFNLGLQGSYTRLVETTSAQTWNRQEFREWLSFPISSEILFRGEFRQVLFSSPEETRTQSEAALNISVADRLQLAWEYSREGGLARGEVTLSPAPVLTLKIGVEARWGEEGQPTRFAGILDFAYEFSWAPPFLPVFGVLSGKVFADLDGDGAFDPEEPGLAGVTLALDDFLVSTGKTGEFRFPGRPPGTYVLEIARLPLGYAAPTREFSVNLELGKETELLIPVVPLAEIRGTVFLDADGDGVQSASESGLARVYVRIVSEETGQVVEVFSDPTGSFGFAEFLPGRYRVELVQESLPARHEPTTPTVLEVFLSPGAREHVVFGVRERPRPVVVIQPPLAEFVWTPAAPKAEEPVLFDGTISQAFDTAEIVRYAWDFNDDGEIDAEGPRVTWTFSEPGFYLVTLIVTDSAGLTGQTQYLLQVWP